MSNPFGFRDYGVNDTLNPIIFQSSLTSLASLTTPTIGSATLSTNGTGHIFDAVKGVKMPLAGGYFTLNPIANTIKIDYAGSISFDVETQLIACDDATSEGSSGGISQTKVDTFLNTISNPPGGGNNWLFVNVQNKQITFTVGDGVGQQTVACYISDAIGKGQFCRFIIAWDCNKFYYYINKLLIGTALRTVNLVRPHDGLYLGVSAGTGVNLSTGFMRNLQLCSRPLVFAVPYLLSNWMAFGDSYADGGFSIGTTSRDLEKGLVLDSKFRELGIRIGQYNGYTYGGRKVIGNTDANLHLRPNIAAALAVKPTYVAFQAGANDLTTNGTLDISAFTLNMKAIVEQFFGVNGYPTTTVRGMGVHSTPWAPQYPTVADALLRKPDITSINTIQASLPSWFNTTYPALAGRLSYQDTFSDFGGFNPNPLYYSAADLLHPGPRGRYIMGGSWYEGTMKVFRNIQ